MPIGKIDGDPPLHGDPEPTGLSKDPGVPLVSPPPIAESLGDPRPLGGGPDIEPSQVMLPPIDPAEYNPVLELAQLDLAERLGLHTIDPVRLVKLGKMEWANTSLGNPQPGMMYAPVIVPRFKMLFEADGAFYMYHTSLEEAVFVDGRSVVLVTSVGSGEPVEVVLVPPPKDDGSGEVVAVTPPPKEDVEDLDGQAVRVGPGAGELIDPLLATGADVEVTGEVVKQPFFSEGGRILLVNGERVQVMEYRDAADLEDEAAHISPHGSSTGTTMVSWVAPPHFFRNETVIVLYVGENTKARTLRL